MARCYYLQPMVADEQTRPEMGTIERVIEIDASIETVFEVITSPHHLTEWWPDEALFEPHAGATGQLVFGDRGTGDATIPNITIVSIEAPTRFTFRWTHPDDEPATHNNSLLVEFELERRNDHTQVRMTETGFRERGWEVAVLEEQYRLHDVGWDRHLARLLTYAPTVKGRG